MGAQMVRGLGVAAGAFPAGACKHHGLSDRGGTALRMPTEAGRDAAEGRCWCFPQTSQHG